VGVPTEAILGVLASDFRSNLASLRNPALVLSKLIKNRIKFSPEQKLSIEITEIMTIGTASAA
jgi:hypothetical protein